MISLGKKIKIHSGALVVVRGQGWGGSGVQCPLLHHFRLLVALDSPDSEDGGHAQICAVLVLMPDAAKCGPGILVDGGPPQEVASLLWLDLRYTTMTALLSVTGSTTTFL